MINQNEQKYFSQIFDNTCMMNMGNKMDLQQRLLQVQIKFKFPGDLNKKNNAANLYHIITSEFYLMIFHEKSTILANICMRANSVLP